MPTIRLDRWLLLDAAPGEGAGFATTGGEGWLPVDAPGDTYLALVAAGRLPHPFQDRNEDSAHWVRTREWWQRTAFTGPEARTGETVDLVFEGLDTFATIYLDGVEIGRTDNMFRRHVFDITGRVTPGAAHILAIRFEPPGDVITGGTLPVWSAFKDRVSHSNRNLIRKAQFGWGWDWGPDLPTVGIWRPAFIETRPGARLTGIRFATLDASALQARCDLGIETANASPTAQLHIALYAPDGGIVARRTVPASAAVTLPLQIDDPALWWTADLGTQPLYTLAVTLTQGARTLDEHRQRVGLRTIRLDTSADPDEPGASFFRFLLNGVPIFAKGACWVPSTSFVGALDEAAYRRLIAQSAAANMNMIRIWGGGIYEPDLFYDLCDEMGVLVWQDFMFACAHYPEDDAFQANVRAEIADQVVRLRNHACLALWCGNNECQAMHSINNDMSGETGALSGLALYDGLMPDMLARLDPVTPYWPSSPWGGPNPNSMRAGDVHDWTVWHGIPPIPDAEMVGGFQSTPEGIDFSRYAEDRARFVSEFGIQAAPALATLRRWMDKADLTPESPGFHQRIKDEARKAESLMSTHTGTPKSLQDYVDFTQWIQAEGLRFGIEHFRRRSPHCAGALLWQLNDCWPSVSWSLIDYDGVEKAGYHAVRRAFAPVFASFRDVGDTAELWLANDRHTPFQAAVTVSLETLSGRILHRETLTGTIPASARTLLWHGPKPQGHDQVLRVFSPDGTLEPHRLFAVPIAALALVTDAEPTVTITAVTPTEIRIHIAADAYLPFVHVVSDRPDLAFSDNHFDLAAGEIRHVKVSGIRPLSPHDMTVRWWQGRA